ncbi:MAG: hypothetical protein ABEJ91_04050 [Candidatus Nanohaloarchaea archaeon]
MLERFRRETGFDGKEELLASLTTLISGIVLFVFTYRMAFRFEAEPVVAVLVTLAMYGYSFLLIAGGLSGGFNGYDRFVAYSGVLLLVLFVGMVSMPQLADFHYRTDSVLYTRYSVDLVLEGKNPYRYSMHEAFNEINRSGPKAATPRIDGSMVDTFSYPAGTLYAFIPQVVLGVPNIRLTLLPFLAAVFVFLFYESPDYLVLAPFSFFFVAPAVLDRTLHGFTGVLWLLPLLLSMKYWKSGRLRASMVFLGLSFSVKQIPWSIAFFLAVWIYRESDGLADYLRRLKVPVLYGGGTFLLLNAPFIVTGPLAWLRGVMDPVALGTSLVSGGIGLTALGQNTVQAVPKQFFGFAMAAFLFFSLFAYWLYFERAKWIAWMMPGFLLWFSYRFYENYFVFFIPAAYYALLLKTDIDRGGEILERYHDWRG